MAVVPSLMALSNFGFAKKQVTLIEGAHIVVVGAGFAGISCARALSERGYKVTVLEAQKQIGGRVKTMEEWGTPIDLGASWLHGGPQNPLKSVAAQAGIPTFETNYMNAIAYGEDWQIDFASGFDRGHVTKSLSSGTMWAYAELMIRRAFGWEGPDLSVAELLNRAEQKGGLDPKIVCLTRRGLESLYASPLEELGFAALIAASETDPQGTDFDAKGEQFVTGGMIEILKFIQGTLPVLTEQKVSTIQTDGAGVTVVSGGEEFQADAAVVTVSVGALASGAIRFDPVLPMAKRKALKTLDMGTMNKIAMRFPSVFWPEDRDFLTLCDGICSTLWNLHHYAGEPILVGLMGGPRAIESESMSDRALLKRTLSDLNQALGVRVPEPEAFVRTRWLEDPFSRGAYSRLRLGATGLEHQAIAHPVDGRLFFAGEATHSADPSTVHGAFWSGLRAADEIVAHTHSD